MRAMVLACGALGARGILRLMESGFDIPLVFTDETLPSIPVRDLCREKGIVCATPRDPNQYGWIERARDARPDMLFSFAYHTHPKAQLLAIPRNGSFGIHRALLPRLRGPEPVRRAIMDGEGTTGATLHELVVDPYAGAIVAREPVDIEPDDTAMTLSEKIDRAADAMLAAVLPRMRNLDIPLTPQDLSAGSTHRELAPEDGGISWDRTAGEIHDLVRAFTRPYSGAYGILGEEMVFFWKAARADDVSLEPGVPGIRGETALIGTGCGSLEPREIEVNGRVLAGPEILRFFREHEGEAFQQ